MKWKVGAASNTSKPPMLLPVSLSLACVPLPLSYQCYSDGGDYYLPVQDLTIFAQTAASTPVTCTALTLAG